ncbi:MULTISPECIES: histidine--tRNA ligase [Pediococcus]|uniref:Histidine--tRNA ligase n=1 Tax=Pediococcus pentosaceus (strain ATCC 25745 / CCUG 21536 / LMG 10740 / 183-1w) TaxID=278197 RepID=SYH_PEDPA|nr:MULTISPECIES: histidine--tRNA ligase [Pediococcus]Q03F51.1 RecName: Full=Histidine--tRNA ligase; AltName: Full=Histidyl-tRNA synthetase; Short=HisRS [Pediococcus pentosaceus ATCC 25745]ABJ68171.1 histidyl-tRNA synthetase [Pediococcus pentosaceus ATCC 25745]KAF5441116.1 histidine--tRNA ligase [Pediococcus sp. EKM202D]KAF5441321.1 histidine--tRNA ligase [Pediococcus sp. EKM201D]MBF7102184.1 histidine--tRNA ligase [Pediococcus pentosaceus]MBF7125937.1 histidine--tRNA ligase [Pediococcus pento
MKYQKPKGTADILPPFSKEWQFVEQNARETFALYNYEEIRTPIFEKFEVFSRSAGDTSDIVTKEMYDFDDKGGRHIALRPEGTAGVVRAFVENKLYGPEHQKPVKVYYMGPMFRYERPQSGRLREFHQIGVEAFGSDSPKIDVETIMMGMDFLKKLKVSGLKLVINTLGDKESRDRYRQALIDYLEPHFEELSDDSKARLHKNPLRVLDSKDKNDQKIVENAPEILDFLTEDAQKHFTSVKEELDTLGVDYVVDSSMVRGLDYYNHTIFEIMIADSPLGKGDVTICAGGRYNGLVEELGGPEVSGVGFGLGVERLLLLLNAETQTTLQSKQLDFYVVGIGDLVQNDVLKVVHELRQMNFVTEQDYLDRKPKAQFKSADKLNAKYVVTIGESEMNDRIFKLKDMHSGEERTVALSEINTLKDLLK